MRRSSNRPVPSMSPPGTPKKSNPKPPDLVLGTRISGWISHLKEGYALVTWETSLVNPIFPLQPGGFFRNRSKCEHLPVSHRRTISYLFSPLPLKFVQLSYLCGDQTLSTIRVAVLRGRMRLVQSWRPRIQLLPKPNNNKMDGVHNTLIATRQSLSWYLLDDLMDLFSTI